LSKNSKLVNNTKKYSQTQQEELQMLKTICIDAEKTNPAYSKTIQHFGGATRPIYQTLSFEIATNQKHRLHRH
jgi:hypothetical protein